MALMEGYNKTFEYKREYYIDGVLKCLSEENFDVLILYEKLESMPVDINILDTITDHYPNLQVIFAMEDSHKEDEFCNRLYALGVYDGIFVSDFEITSIAELLNAKRTKKEAKDYYGIDEKIDDMDIKFQVTPLEEDILNKTISTLEVAIKEGTLNEIFKQIDNEFNPKEMCYLLTMLPDSISEALKNSNDKVFAKYEKKVNKEVQKFEKQINKESKPQIRFIEKIKEIPIVEKVEVIREVPKEIIKEVIKEVEVEKEKTVVVEKEVLKINHVRYDSIIAFISNSPTGKSYVAWNFSHALSENYKVSLINIDDSSSANAFFGIDSGYDAPLQDIENKAIKQIIDEGVKINKNLTVYSGKIGERAELKRNVLTQLISAIRAEGNNIVIIDTATGYSNNLISAISMANDILVVYTMDNVHIKMNDLLMERLKDDLNKNNTIAVINNAYRTSKEYKSLLSYLNQSNKYKDVVTINNCGATTYDYMFSQTCNYKKDNNEFSRDIDILINTLKLQGKEKSKSVSVKSNETSLFNKILRRNR